jgi:DNA-directed RNA polymerase subunit RPC12/RpoP
MIIKCPNCQSNRIVTKDVAKKTCGTTRTLSGAELGGTIAVIASALLNALVDGATGCVAGAKLGEVIDDRILDNYQCLACNYEFSQKTD